MLNRLSSHGWISTFSVWGSVAWIGSLLANPGGGLIADGSMGTQIQAQENFFTIQGGIQSGPHLLHSFREFNLEVGQVADFHATPKITHIISRITGDQPSWINGTLTTSNTTADLYLINPQGILFGPQAHLDLSGAFHASTADYLRLSDGSRLYADPNQGVNLMVAAPEAFGFLDAQVGKIQLEDAHISVNTGQQMSFVGGEITLQANTQLQAPAGRIVLAAVAGAGEIRVDEAGITSQVVKHADINLINSTLYVDNRADSTAIGRIAMQGEQVTIKGGYVGLANYSAVDATGVSLGIKAKAIQVSAGALLSTATYGAGQGGMVHLQAARNMTFTGGAELTATADSRGAGGLVLLQAGQSILFQNADITVLTRSSHVSAGRGGDVQIIAKAIRFSEGGQIWARTEGVGVGGSVKLQATDLVQMGGRGDDIQGSSGITVSTNNTQGSAGDGGTVIITARDIIFLEGAGILAETYGPGQGGSVTLQAENNVIFRGEDPTGYYTTGIVVNTNGTSAKAGAGGDLQITAANIVFDGDAGIKASTTGTAQGGSVRLQAAEQVIFRGTQIAGNALHGMTVSTESTAAGAGNGGDVQILATDIILTRGTQLLAATMGTGTAGRIRLQAEQGILINGATHLNSSTQGTGDAGTIDLRAQRIGIRGGTIIASESHAVIMGAGRAGSLILLADEAITLSGGSSLTTAAQNAGGGDIQIEAQARFWLQDSQISTSVQGGDAQGGSIRVDPIFILLENSQLQANAYGGSGGNISLQADYLLRSGPVKIEASSALSAPGTIQIQAVSFNRASLAQGDQVEPLHVVAWQPISCDQGQSEENRLRKVGYDAHPTPIDDVWSSLPVWVIRSPE